MSFVVTAVATTAVTGLYGAYSSYQASQAQADAIEDKAEQDRKLAEAQLERDAAAESEVAKKERADARRRRDLIEASYAKSGVLLDGSAADVLTKQREVDETNIQNIHVQGGNQRALDRYAADENLKSSLYAADATRSAGKTSLVSNILSTGTSAMGAYGAFSRPGVGSVPGSAATGKVGAGTVLKTPASKANTSSLNFGGGTQLKRWF